MLCEKSSNVISVLLDGAGSEQSRWELADHARTCPVCAEVLSDQRRVRQTLAQMPKRQPSMQLQASLQVMASRERKRTLTRLNFASQFAEWRGRARLTLRNMMQPFALPVAGGLASALLLFGLLLPDFTFKTHPIHNDVPTVLFTQASVKDTVPLRLTSEIIVDLQVDETGRMIDYTVVSGGSLLHDEAFRSSFETALLFTQFTPATTFGQPTSGRIRVSFRSSTVEDVKG
jgi:hypothetical protein